MTTITGLKYSWQLPEVNKDLLIQYSSLYNLCFPVMQVLLSRGYNSKELLDSYLFSTFEGDVFNPALLKDAEKAVDRLLYAIKNQEKILICGDYDVDGITSSAMMLTCLLPLGADINFFLPNRVKDGYGLSVKTVQRAAKSGYKLLITVDNGITAFDPVSVGNNLGIDTIITDHHKPHDHTPSAYAIINPHQKDCFYPYKTLAGVGVTFKLLSLLYQKLGKTLPEKVYELLLLGTIADVVPLTGENRFWVKYGLQHINKIESSSLKVLKKNSRITKSEISSLDIGFFITPQINALGRLEDPRSGVKFLIGSDFEETQKIGSVLKELNEARRAIEKSIYDNVDELIKNKNINLDNEKIILAGSTEWQPGVIGLVASKLVGAYNRPVLLYHIKDGLAKGSCRSISAYNIFDALHDHKELLLSFGGHSMAAGFSLKLENLDKFKSSLEQHFNDKIPIFEAKPNIKLDGEISLTDVNKKMVTDLNFLEPFGNENNQPVFYLKNVTLLDNPQLLKDAHVKCLLFSEGIIKPIIFFNRLDIYERLKSLKNENISVAAYISENNWQGKSSIELQGLDIAL